MKLNQFYFEGCEKSIEIHEKMHWIEHDIGVEVKGKSERVELIHWNEKSS